MITQTARRISIFALTITMLSVLPACSSQPASRPSSYPASHPTKARVERPRTIGERAANVALSQVGVPYRYGGSTRSGFDCSGLVQYSYKQAGKRIPRTTRQLWSSSSTVARHELQVGDLLFFSIEGKMSHVGLYLGDQQFVHAPSSGRTVSVERLTSPFYSAALIRVGRPH
jgi:cell wall-associated NlpC family hydrolase